MPGMISGLKKQVSKTTKLLFFPGSKTRFERNFRRVRNLLLLVLLSVLLWYITVKTGLDASVRAPLLVLRPYWLVLILWSIVLAYISTKRLVELLRSEPSFQLFPEIDENWNFITKQLAELGVDLKDLPVILVLGHRPAESVHYFDHLQLRLRNVRMRNDSETNFHVDLSDSAIFVTCQSVSLLGLLSRRLEQNRSPNQRSRFTGSKFDSPKDRPSQLLGLTGESEKKNESDKSIKNNESKKADFGHSQADSLAMPADEIEITTARLKYLCHLISKARDPICPINGVVLVIPKEITETQQLNSNAIEMARLDLKSIRDETGADMPYAVLATNLQYVDGFSELLKNIDSSSKLRYLGVALPTRLDITTSSWLKQMRRGLRSFRMNVIPALVSREMLQVPPSALGPEASGRSQSIQINHTSYRFLQEIGRFWRHMEYFCAKINQFQLENNAGNPRFAGLFLTGLETSEVGPWVFIHEFVKHLLSQQNSISWTPEALIRNRFQKWLALIIMIFLFAVFACFVALLIWIYFR
jgi:hypothetical protein